MKLITKPAYLKEALKARAAHELIGWHRAGRTDEACTRKRAAHPFLFLVERCTIGLLPIFLHHLILNPFIVFTGIGNFFRFLHSFVTDADFRERWFLDQIEEGRKDGMLNQEEYEHIVSIVKDPFIVKYLKSVAVHFATIPVTQIVSVIVGGFAAAYVLSKGGTKLEASAAFGAMLVLFQIIPISPGSLCRGFYVVFLMIKERNWKDYLVACPLSFVKYIGYLAFPLQMTTTYPDLARFMASRWATNAVHIIPVFGEHGALFEHWIFDLFFNVPQILGRHLKGMLTAWLVLGLALIGPALFVVTTKGWVGLMMALIAVFICPRAVFYPLLNKKQ